MKQARNRWTIGLVIGLLLAALTLFICTQWHNFLPAPDVSLNKSNVDTVGPTQTPQDSSNTDDRLLEDAFAGTQKPEAEDANLKVGAVPLSKFHPAAAKEFELGNRLAEDKKWSEAHSHYIKCMNEIHKDQETRVVMLDENWFSVCYGVIAICLSERNQFVAAVNHLDEAIRLDQGIMENFVLRGNLYQRLHKNKEAQANYRMASSKSVMRCYPAWAQKSPWCRLPRATAAAK